MKCIPIILCGLVVAFAIASIDIDDVFVARIAFGRHMLSNSENVSIFSWRTSGIASTIKSQSERSFLLVDVVMRSIADWESLGSIRP